MLGANLLLYMPPIYLFLLCRDIAKKGRAERLE
jgi:hypothetical protein